MPTIRPLPVSLVNKIAAGEVIERPASVVKELLENSIDAGASRIELSVEGGGLELIRIADNGCGIEADQLILAVSPHATSKLTEADDLFDVRTLGFRGEALASIAEVSHTILRSRTAASDSGAELNIRGGNVEGPRDCASPVGTTIEVRNLFFNTPVRRKFLKSSQTEMGHVIEAFTRIALAHPMVHMLLIHNGRVLHDLAASERWQERIAAFFGTEVSDQLIRIDSRDDEIRLHGFVVDPSVSRANNRMQYLFLNGRYIRDRSLQHALSEAYRGLLMVGRFPICFLHLDLPPNQVDVNVHPTKSEVRFMDGGEVYRRLLQTLRAKFLSTDLTAKIGASEIADTETSQSVSQPWPARPASQAWDLRLDREHTATVQPSDSLLQWGQGLGQRVDISIGSGSTPSFRPFPDPDSFSSRSWSPSTPSLPRSRPEWSDSNDDDLRTSTEPRPQQSHGSGSRELSSDSSALANMSESRGGGPHSNALRPLGFQIHNRYLVTEDEAGMVVIDQHALHERILYEQIRDRVLSSSLERQRLLIPETVTLTGPEVAAVLNARETLAQIGIEVESFGGDTIIVTSYPAILTKVPVGEMVRQVIEPLLEAGKAPSARDLLDSMMHMMSCKAAIKAGDKLANEEISALLEQRHHFADTHHCPHGRPTALFFSRDQLDKMFKRT